jgi:hypothetical protein
LLQFRPQALSRSNGFKRTLVGNSAAMLYKNQDSLAHFAWVLSVPEKKI